MYAGASKSWLKYKYLGLQDYNSIGVQKLPWSGIQRIVCGKPWLHWEGWSPCHCEHDCAGGSGSWCSPCTCRDSLGMLTQSNIKEDVQETPLPDINVRVFGESTVLVIEAPRQVSVRAGRVGSSGKATCTTKLVACCAGDKVSEVFFFRCHGSNILQLKR